MSGSRETSGSSLDTNEHAEIDNYGPGKILPPFNVVLLDDDHHTYAYVIDMLSTLFGLEQPRAWKMADEVNEAGRAIVCTTSKERAELKRDQIHAYGADPRLKESVGSMSAVIEPCPR